MPITYNASENTIAVLGGTETSPYTFEDIYQADVAGGWGVVEKKETAYFVHASVQIGDSSQDGWLVDKAKQVFFYADYAIKNAAKTGHFILGEIENETEKTTKNGCYVECHGSFFTNTKLQEIQILDSTIVSKKAGNSSFPIDHYEGKIWNSKLHGIIFRGFAANVDIYNVEVGNLTPGVVSSPFTQFSIGTGNIEKIVVTNCDYAATHYFNAPIVIKKLTARNIRVALVEFKRALGGQSFAIDWDVDWSQTVLGGNSFRPTKLRRQYSFNVLVQDEENNPVAGAQVLLKDNADNNVYTAVTDTEGKTPIQIIDWGYYTLSGSSCVSYPSTPHTLTVTKPGFQKYEVKIELNRKLTKFPVILKRATVNVDQEVLL